MEMGELTQNILALTKSTDGDVDRLLRLRLWNIEVKSDMIT